MAQVSALLLALRQAKLSAVCAATGASFAVKHFSNKTPSAPTILSAIIGGLIGGVAGCTAGAAFGDAIDDTVLDNFECLDCQHSFHFQAP